MCVQSDKPATRQNSLNSIELIKRIGRLHDQLCAIMDDINFCYSFQVIPFDGHLIVAS